MASNFHTFVISDIPVLSLLQKNEARRFITLLDALYEARCKLLVQAAAGPDGLFFPETPKNATGDEDPSINEDGTYPETFSEIYQDQTNPFRPNVSSYSPSASEPSYASSPLPLAQSDPVHGQAKRSVRSILADEDSDFGPTYGAGRSWGASSGSSGAGSDSSPNPYAQTIDFQRTTTFTGEDERFAYKRAQSRLWEMCGARWWARQQPGWWRPLDEKVRHWERAAAAAEEFPADSEVREQGLSESQRASPFRTIAEPPVKISWTHVWGLMTWGKKAGAWGQGVDGLKDRKKVDEKQSEGKKGE